MPLLIIRENMIFFFLQLFAALPFTQITMCKPIPGLPWIFGPDDSESKFLQESEILQEIIQESEILQEILQ